MDAGEKALTLAWVRAWDEAGPALEAVKREELRELTPERALFFSDGLLSLPYPDDVRERRRPHSGLVEQQALFRKLRRR